MRDLAGVSRDFFVICAGGIGKHRQPVNKQIHQLFDRDPALIDVVF